MSTDPEHIPYWTDDPLIDKNAHQLNLHQNGPEITAGCTCGARFTNIGWGHAIFEIYDIHMYEIQMRARAE